MAQARRRKVKPSRLRRCSLGPKSNSIGGILVNAAFLLVSAALVTGQACPGASCGDTCCQPRCCFTICLPRIHLPSFHCCQPSCCQQSCQPACQPACDTCCQPSCGCNFHLPRLCLPQIHLPRLCWPSCGHNQCCESSCQPSCAPACDTGCGHGCSFGGCGHGCGLFSRLSCLFPCQHHNNCCDTCDNCSNGACAAPGHAAPVSSEPIPGPKAIPAQGTSNDGGQVRIVTPPAASPIPHDAPVIQSNPEIVPSTEAINRNPF